MRNNRLFVLLEYCCKYDYILENILSTILITLAFSLILVSLFFQHIFKADYRPGYRSMPFIWYPMVTNIYKLSRQAFVLSKIYNVHVLSGMCKILEKQQLFSISIWGKKYVILFTPEAAEVVLSSTKIIEKSDDYEGFRPILRDGLFLSKGEKWRTRRKLLTPTFHLKILQDFTPVLQQTAKDLVSDLQTVTNEPWVDIFLIMKTCSLNMLLRTTLGFDVDVKSKEAVECLKASDEYTTCLSARLARPWLFSDTIFKFTALCKKMEECANLAHNFLRKVIKLKKQNMLNSGQLRSKNEVQLNGHAHIPNGTKLNGHYLPLKSKNKAFLDLLLEYHFQDNSLTEEDILDEALSFFAAGAETLGSAISYVLYCIGLHEDVQTKLQEEQDKIFGNTDRDLIEEDIKRMDYLDCVIKEGLRLYSASFVSRRATEDFKVFDYTIQKGSIVVIFNYVIHRDPRYYPNPEKFDPSRFSADNCIGRHPFAYLPFSAGPRNCIGQKFTLLEMKTVCSAILRKYHLTSIDNTDELYKISNLTNLTNVPVRLKFDLRSNNQ